MANDKGNLTAPMNVQKNRAVSRGQVDPFVGPYILQYSKYFLIFSGNSFVVLWDVDQNHQIFSSRSSFRIAFEIADTPTPQYRSLPPPNPIS